MKYDIVQSRSGDYKMGPLKLYCQGHPVSSKCDCVTATLSAGDVGVLLDVKGVTARPSLRQWK